jgi:hypothetical protein
MQLSELRQCVSLLLRVAEERGVTEIASPQDGYWTVVSPGWRDVYVDPAPSPGVGSFSDDEDNLRELLLSPERASAVDLERASHLLRLLADQLAGSP